MRHLSFCKQRPTAALLCVMWLLAAALPAAETAAPFDGQWSLEFRVTTRPGGESFTTTQGIAVAPFTWHFLATTDDFRFNDDRTAKFEERQQARLQTSSLGRFASVTITDRFTAGGLVRAEATGTGDEERRQVRLTLQWSLTAGSGIAASTPGGSSHHRWQAADDASTVTLTNEAGSRSFPNLVWTSQWNLAPASIDRRELAPDSIMETAVYRGRRTSRLDKVDPVGFTPPLPVIEEIELRQTRHLKLVPRG